MPKLVILDESTIWLTAPFPHGKRTRKKLPGSCRGRSGLKEKRSIPISTGGTSNAVLGQTNAVQSSASTIDLFHPENEGREVCYKPPFSVCV